jgi:hypothetical protein
VIISSPDGLAMKAPCYRVTSVGLHVRSDDNLADKTIGEKIENADLLQEAIGSSTEQTQVASDPEAPQSEPITWLKISQPVEGWVAKDNLSSSNDCSAAATGKN